MAKTIRNKIYACFLVILLLITSLFSMGFTTASADTNELKFDQTNVMDDLRSSKTFNVLNYPFYQSEKPEMYIMNVVEYCYSFDVLNQNEYGLYLYLYNPNGRNIDTTDGANNVQMGVSYNADGKPTDYEKFDLKFCSKSEEKFYEGLFYKFKVIDHVSADGKTMVQRVKSSARRYDISGIEILEKNKTLPVDYGVGGTYTFKGYAKGYGADTSAESTLTCEINELETISLEVHSTYYRTGEYETNHRHDLTSVYFAVPNRFFEEYGKLQKIKAEWYEYQTTPICVTSSDTVYDLLYPYLGQYTYESSGNYLQLYTGYQQLVGSNGHYDKYDWAYNCDYTTAINESCKRISYLFSTNGAAIGSYVLSSERIKSYVQSYNKSFTDGYINIPGKTISHDLFEKTLSESRTAVPYVGNDIHHKLVEFDADNTFDMLSYDETHSGWHKFFAKLFGLAPNDVDQSYKGISPIHIVTAEDMAKDNLASTLLIDGSDDALEDFRDFYNKSTEEDKTVVLFRFAQTDYMNLPVIAYNSKTGTNISKQYGKDTYIITESVFLNFDIIQLTFNKEGVYTVIPVVNSPIDIYNDITIPAADGLAWWQILLAIIFLILALWLLSITGILPLLVKGIVWLILLPFRLIGKLLKAITKKRKKE